MEERTFNQLYPKTGNGALRTSNHAPVVNTVIEDQSLVGGEEWVYNLPEDSFVDQDVIDGTDSLTYHVESPSGEPVPSWLKIDPLTGTLSGVPEKPGSYDVMVIAVDQEGAFAQQIFTLEVKEAGSSLGPTDPGPTDPGEGGGQENRPPMSNRPIRQQTIKEKEEFVFQIPDNTFIDPDGDELTITVTQGDGSPLPKWLSFDPTTNTLKGTPGKEDVTFPAPLSIKVIATDPGGLSTSLPFNIRVQNVNDAPVANGELEPQTIELGQEWVYTIPEGSFTDADVELGLGDFLSYRLEMADGSAVPSWLSIHGVTGEISGIPEGEGVLDLVIVASDLSGESAKHKLTLNIQKDGSSTEPETPDPENPDPENPGGNPDPENPDPENPDPENPDPENPDPENPDPENPDPESPDPENPDPETPDPGEGGGQENRPPMSNRPIRQQTIKEKEEFVFQIPDNTFIDPDGDELTITVTQGDGSPLPKWLSFDPTTNTLKGTPGKEDVTFPAPLSIKVIATDPGGLSTSLPFNIRVQNVNDAPVANGELEPQTIELGQEWVYTIPEGSFTDADVELGLGDFLSYRLEMADGSAVPSWLSIHGVTGEISGIPEGEGVLDLVIVASDLSGESAKHKLTLNIQKDGSSTEPETPDPENPDPENPGGNPDPENPDPENPDPENPDPENPDPENPDPENPDPENPDPENPDPENPDPENPDPENPDPENPDPENPDPENPDPENPINNRPPVANGKLEQGVATLGKNWVYKLPEDSFTDPDTPDGDVLRYSLRMRDGSPVPKWLEIDPQTGLVSGVPKEAGDYGLVIIATDKAGASAQHYMSLIVSPRDNHEIIVDDHVDFAMGTDGNDTIIGHDNGASIYAGKGDDTIYGGKGDDRIFGQEGDNTIEAGKGNDYISGGIGNNRYIFNLGDGHDTIVTNKRVNAESIDIIQFNDISPKDVSFRGEDYDLIIDYGNGADSVRIEGFFIGTNNHKIDSILFKNGNQTESITLDNLKNMVIPVTLTGKTNQSSSFQYEWDGILNIQTTGSGDRVKVISSKNGSILNGGDGNDRLHASAGDSTLIGGKGDDYLIGNEGNNTYIFNPGDGNDVVNNYAFDNGRYQDKVELKGISSTDSSFILKRTENNLDIFFGGSSVSVKNYYLSDDYKIDSIVLADKVLTREDIGKIVIAEGQEPEAGPFAVDHQARTVTFTNEQEVHSLRSAMASFGGGNGAVSTDISSIDDAASLASYLVTTSM